tara:strand:+ start:970 stop:1215 length:246 start_codon:yes stop_codon:yes gene_type:complete
MPSKKLEENQKTSNVWSVGDFVWFIPNGEKKPQQGEIVKIYDNIENPCASLIMVLDSKYRTSLLSMLSETSKGAKKILESS